jgi:hypothetical protein
MNSTNMAADRLRYLVQSKGETFLKMSGSVKAFFLQELAEFPEEKAVIEATYNAGICDQLKTPDGENREKYFASLSEKMAKKLKLHPEWAKWAVKTWLYAVESAPNPTAGAANSDGNTQLSTQEYADVNLVNRQDNDPQLKILYGRSPIWAKAIMTMIVVSGAFLGGLIGRTWPVATLLIGFTIVDESMGQSELEKFLSKGKKASVSERLIGTAIYIVVVGTPSAICSAFGALVGWLIGKADGKPWIGFAACFSAAFGTNTLVPFFTMGWFLTLGLSISGCFLASYKTAVTTN